MWKRHFEKLYSLICFFSLGYSTLALAKNKINFELVNLNVVVPGSYMNQTGIELQVMCGISCKRDVKCVSFAFHPIRNECRLYDRNINQTTTVNKDINMRSFVMTLDWTNLAAYKSTYSSSTGTGLTSQAVDGDTKPHDFGSTVYCFQTEESDLNPWFIIDLEEEYFVQYIYVYNADDYPERLHDVNYELYQENPALNSSAAPNCCASVPHFTTGRNIVRCNPGVSGRYLKISIEKSQFLTLCEVEVFGEKATGCCRSDCKEKNYTCYRLPGGDNIAFQKNTKQSSTFSTCLPSYGTDGVFATYYSQCTHTDLGDRTPYWQVDLQSQYNITSVTIANRVDAKQGVGHRLRDVTIATYVEDPLSGGTSTVCKFIPGEFGCTVRTFECDQVTVGRWLRISKPTEALSLCEVQVTGNQING